MTTRSCSVCHGQTSNLIYRQSFVFPDVTAVLHYDVVECDGCGFIFADNIPAEEELNAYYASSGHHLHVEVPIGLQQIHAEMYQFVRQHTELSQQHRVLDIGSSMGHFLNYFHQAGFSRLLGIEPSLGAAKLACEHYGIDVLSSSFMEYEFDDQFELITLCGVLEHLLEPDKVLAKIRTLLVNTGAVFIAVPDADAFGSISLDEPFLEFALEHINFFGLDSLTHLFQVNGFEVSICESVYNSFYNNNYLYLIAKKTERQQTVASSGSVVTRNSIQQYIAHSMRVLKHIDAMMAALIETQESLIVWGVGSFTRRLCATSKLDQTSLIGFIDKNPDLYGKSMLGQQIYSPEWLLDKKQHTVFIASTTYANEIRQELLCKYNWQGKILMVKQSD